MRIRLSVISSEGDAVFVYFMAPHFKTGSRGFGAGFSEKYLRIREARKVLPEPLCDAPMPIRMGLMRGWSNQSIVLQDT